MVEDAAAHTSTAAVLWLAHSRSMSGKSACGLAILAQVAPARCSVPKPLWATGMPCIRSADRGWAAKQCCVMCSRVAVARTGRMLRTWSTVSSKLSLTTIRQSATQTTFAARIVPDSKTAMHQHEDIILPQASATEQDRTCLYTRLQAQRSRAGCSDYDQPVCGCAGPLPRKCWA